MIVVSFSPAAVSTTVWAQTIRSLTVDPATDAGAATLVWTHAARAVTSLAPALTPLGSVSQSVGAGVLLDLRPAANKFRLLMVQADGNFQLGNYNGTTFTQFPYGTQQHYEWYANATQGATSKNGSAGALNLSWTGIEIA